jgi:hypothetical protein
MGADAGARRQHQHLAGRPFTTTASLIRVTDAHGKLIATIDPMTRVRTDVGGQSRTMALGRMKAYSAIRDRSERKPWRA